MCESAPPAPRDKPAVDNRGTAERPRFHVVGILTASNELRLPGGTFGTNDRQKLADYFAAPRGRRPRIDDRPARPLRPHRERVHRRPCRSCPTDRLHHQRPIAPHGARSSCRRKFTLRLAPDAAADRIIRTAAPVADEVSNLTAGTGLAIVLRSYGLALRPEKSRRTGRAPHRPDRAQRRRLADRLGIASRRRAKRPRRCSNSSTSRSKATRSPKRSTPSPRGSSSRSTGTTPRSPSTRSTRPRSKSTCRARAPTTSASSTASSRKPACRRSPRRRSRHGVLLDHEVISSKAATSSSSSSPTSRSNRVSAVSTGAGLVMSTPASFKQVERVLRAAAFEERQVVVQFRLAAADDALAQRDRGRQAGGVLVDVERP